MKSLLALLLLTGTAQAASYVQPLNCPATSIALNTPSTSATVQCPATPPPPVTGSCTQGAAGDVAGYTAQCGGTYRLHSGGQDKVLGPTQYTYSFVFGDSWPGDTFGAARIFDTKDTQFISIPFKPTPGHTISLNEAQTWTLKRVTFSVSTSPGLFNDGKPGNGVVCVASNNPTLKITSNGNPVALCKLDPNTTYWFNMIPAYYATLQGKWVTDFTGGKAEFAVVLYSVN